MRHPAAIWTRFRDVLQDLRFAVRLLAKAPAFAAVTVATLALGVGGNGAMFAIVYGMNLRGLPVDHPERIVSVMSGRPAAGRSVGVSYLDFQDWRGAVRSFDGIAAYSPTSLNLTDRDVAPDRVSGVFVSAHTFALLGERPILGRDFTADDDRPGAAPVVILGHPVWKSRYASDPRIVGRTVDINGVPTVIIGVMRDGLRFPLVHDAWQPLAGISGLTAQKRDARSLSVFGRLTPRASIREAQAELTTIAAAQARDHVDTNEGVRVVVRPFLVGLGPNDPWTLALAAVGFLLLIACANAASLLLARSAHRSREIAIRRSLGATRWRLVRQLLVESSVLAAIAGVIGVGIAYGGVALWKASLPPANWPYWFRWTVDWPVIKYLVGATFAAAVAFGSVPAFNLSRQTEHALMEDGGRTGSAGIGTRRWTNALLAMELALTLMLLAGAGLMVRSLAAVYRADAVVDTTNVLVMSLSLPEPKYPSPDRRVAFLDAFAERLASSSSVASATWASAMPFYTTPTRTVAFEGRAQTAARPDASYVAIGPAYFDTLRAQLLRGRSFTQDEGAAGHDSAIVNQRFASMYFPGDDPIGRRIRVTNPADPNAASPWLTIVGVSPTIRQRYAEDLDPVVYVPYRSDAGRSPILMIRGRGTAAELTPILREHVRALDSNLPLVNIMPLDELLSGTQFANRVFTTFYTVFAVTALLLSALGLYAATAYAVTQRTREIGIRMALGARRRQVVWLFARRAAALLAVGLAAGSIGAIGVGRAMRAFLIQTRPIEPGMLTAISTLLAVVVIAAALWPARRATRIDPAVALRRE